MATDEPESRDSDEPTGGEGAGQQPTRQTIRVSKELASAAKKIAVLLGLTLEKFSIQVLTSCIQDIRVEISRSTPIRVRERAESINLPPSSLGTLNTTPDIATTLTSLAGLCLTSVAKLVHPSLRANLQKFAANVAPTAHLLETKQGKLPTGDRPQGSVEDFLGLIANTGLVTYRVEGSSLERWGLSDGDVLVAQPADPNNPILPGQLVVIKTDNGLVIRAIKHYRYPRKKLSGQYVPLISLMEAKSLGAERLLSSYKSFTN